MSTVIRILGMSRTHAKRIGISALSMIIVVMTTVFAYNLGGLYNPLVEGEFLKNG